ncbi:MAG: cyclic nucleotide-binding domain-containing protein, partial [Gallionella sp.]|nr:cyclic nucleotide-binding domain-containing protein [Gallionella sp.]
ELSEVRVKLDSTIGRQKKVEQDYLELIEQVTAYAQSGQENPPKAHAQPDAAYAEEGLRDSLESISQLNQALLEQQEILSNTLRLRTYQAQLSAARLDKEREADGTESALAHPQFKLLRGLEFFKSFSNSELLDFMKVAKWQEAEAGETILSEGEVGMSFYILVSGSVNILKKGRRLTSLERGDFFGEFAYLSGEAPVRSAHAVAATACELLAVDPLDIEFSTVQLRLRVVEALLRGQVRRMLLSDQRIDKLSGYLDRSHEPR